ncbi:MAG: DNA methyltransferase [Armatimonas sp.]
MPIPPNTIIEGDALTALERITEESISLVYFDYPFGHSSNDEERRTWLDYISRIVQQARRVLRQDGNIVIHLDSISVIDYRFILSQALQQSANFEIGWHRGRSYGDQVISPRDTLLVYRMSRSSTLNQISIPITENEESRLPLHYDQDGAFRLEDSTSILERPAFTFEWAGHMPPANRSWRFSKAELDSLQAKKLIYFPPNNGRPRIKRYVKNAGTKPVGTEWVDLPALTPISNERIGYPTQKPLILADRLIQLLTNKGDLVLDPFMGTGTTLVAAQQAGRQWIGIDSTSVAFSIVLQRLDDKCGLKAHTDYTVIREVDLLQKPPFLLNYRKVVFNITEIDELQSRIAKLNEITTAVKRLANLKDSESTNEDDIVEQAISLLEKISLLEYQDGPTMESYATTVQSWMDGWEQLEANTKEFLCSAELLYDQMSRFIADDYSPFILQYCKSIENELLCKLFLPYEQDFSRRSSEDTNLSSLINNTTRNDHRTSQICRLIHGTPPTLGQMVKILGFVHARQNSLDDVDRILLDFYSFACAQFNNVIFQPPFRNQIEQINQDFRIKSAHPYLLNIDDANNCRTVIQPCLNALLLEYKG